MEWFVHSISKIDFYYFMFVSDDRRLHKFINGSSHTLIFPIFRITFENLTTNSIVWYFLKIRQIFLDSILSKICIGMFIWINIVGWHLVKRSIRSRRILLFAITKSPWFSQLIKVFIHWTHTLFLLFSHDNIVKF